MSYNLQMKKLKRYTHLFYLFIFIAPLISLLCYFLAPQLLPNTGMVNWLALLLAAIIILSPYGSIKLISTTHPRESITFSLWLTQILLLEIALFMMYIGMCQLNNLTEPLLLASLSQSLRHMGLFPFALIAISAAGFGITTTCRQKDSYFDTIAIGSFQKQFEPLAITIRTFGRALTLFALAISAGMATLATVSVLCGTENLNGILGLSLPATGAAFVMLLLAMRKNSHPALIAIQIERPALGFLMNMLIWVIFLALFSLLLHGHKAPKLGMPAALEHLFTDGWLLHWQLFSLTWWFMIVPITAITIARLCYGYSLRALLLATLALPALLAGLIQNLPAWLVNNSTLTKALTLIGFILFLVSILNKNTLPMVSQTYLPKTKTIKHRSEVIFNDRWKRLCGLFFYLFIPGGIIVLSLLLSLFLLPAALIFLLVLLNLIKLLIRR